MEPNGASETGERRGLNRLSDRVVRAYVAARRANRSGAKKLYDGAGLYLIVTPVGSAIWRFRYRLAGKEKVYTIGAYPAVGLEAARNERDRVRHQVAEGRDPVKARKLTRAAQAASSETTFAGVAAQWLATRKEDWSDVHYEKSRRALERDVFPKLGPLPVAEITPQIVAGVIDTIARRGVIDTTKKILQHIGGVFRYAQARGLRDDNPAAPVHELLPKRKRVTRRPAFLEIAALRNLLERASVAAARGQVSPAVHQAHRLCAFTATRIGNVVGAEWSEFDLEADVPRWVIPRGRMKAQDRDFDHVVILGPTIAAELRIWRTATSGKGYLFPSPQPTRTTQAFISRESIEKVYRETLGLSDQHTPHGWRASFSTLARDAGFARDVVELTLDHVHDTDVARAYDRGERLTERVRLMRWWDTQLAATSSDPKVIPLHATGAA